MIKLISDFLTSEVHQKLSEKLSDSQKENDDLKKRVTDLENAALDHARAISALATIQSNILREMKNLMVDNRRTKTIVRPSDDDIIN
jgi:hypothetical protein